MHTVSKQHNDKIIESLENCVQACNHCAASCLDEANVEEMTSCIKLDLDCAAICNLTLNLIARDSDTVKRIITICGDICQQCAVECEKHDHDHCRECARACRRCAQHCSNYTN